MKLGITAFRATIGAIFFAHGAQKLFGWFGGHGLEATAGAFDSMGLKPGKRNAVVAGASEAGGGALLALGLATPVAAAALIGVMGQAVRSVHFKQAASSSPTAATSTTSSSAPPRSRSPTWAPARGRSTSSSGSAPRARSSRSPRSARASPARR